jgi:hypothetical protein
VNATLADANVYEVVLLAEEGAILRKTLNERWPTTFKTKQQTSARRVAAHDAESLPFNLSDASPPPNDQRSWQ